jgi:hypothetical protein
VGRIDKIPDRNRIELSYGELKTMNLTTSTAEIIKQRIKMTDITSRYDFHPNHSGYICCPFHGEKTPSLKIYPGGQGWYCYGCGEGGSVIDFVMKLFHLNLGQTIEKLNSDFNLGVNTRPITLRDRQKIENEQRIREAKKQHEEELKEIYRLTYNATSEKFKRLRSIKPPSSPNQEPSRDFIQAMQKLDYLEWWLNENITFEKWRNNYEK